MITQIINRITAYSSSVSKPVNVVGFGVGALPAPPYVVVKQEADPGGRGTAFRIITHFQPGQQIALRGYVRATLAEALDNFGATDSDNNYNVLQSDRGNVPGEIVAVNDDETISLERVYWIPDFI